MSVTEGVKAEFMMEVWVQPLIEWAAGNSTPVRKKKGIGRSRAPGVPGSQDAKGLHYRSIHLSIGDVRNKRMIFYQRLLKTDR